MPNPEIRFLNENGSSYPDWEFKPYSDVFFNISSKSYQISSSEYNKVGEYPVVDQGKKFIVGYSDKKSKVLMDIPVIVFGDHTTILKYINFPFIVGADGVQLLFTRENSLSFLYYLLELKGVKSEGYKRHFSILKQFIFNIPCLEEQERIAEFFTHLDNSIMSEEAKLKNIKNYKKSMLQQMFTEDGNPLMRFTKDDGSDYGDWEFKQLSEVTEMIKDGTHGTHIDIIDGVPLLSAKDIKNRKVNIPEDCRKISTIDFDKIHSRYRIKDNDILLTIVGTIGRIALVENYENNIFTLQRSVVIIRVNTNIQPSYLIQYFESMFFQNDLKKNQSVSAQAGIYLGNIGKLFIPLPQIEEQERIAEFFSSLDLQIDLHSKKLANLKKYKKSMLQKMFV